MTRVLTSEEIDYVCARLSYSATQNVRGLGNKTACILFDFWTPNSVCLHSWIPNPHHLTRGFLADVFRYAFSNVDWALGITPGDNEKALAFNRRLGFTVRDRLPNGFARGVDTVYQVMFHNTCKYWRRSE